MSAVGHDSLPGYGPPSAARARRIARVGDEVVAQDGSLGRIEGVIRRESRDPAYLVVAVGRGLAKRYPIVPCTLVTEVDRLSRRVHLRGTRTSLRRLPERLPIVV